MEGKMDDDCRNAGEMIHRLRQKEKVSQSAMKAAAEHIHDCEEPSCLEIKRTMVGDSILNSVIKV